jgi:hypothetical protein
MSPSSRSKSNTDPLPESRPSPPMVAQLFRWEGPIGYTSFGCDLHHNALLRPLPRREDVAPWTLRSVSS